MRPFNVLVDRWGVAAVMAVGAAVILIGLGSPGLWEPWEMDRADLARTIVQPPQVAAAVAAEPATLEADLQRVAQNVGVTLRVSRAQPRRGRDRGRASFSEAERALRSALDLARKDVVAAVLLDTELLLPDPNRSGAWKSAAAKVNEALKYVPNGRVILLLRSGAITPEELSTRVAAERARIQWDLVASDYALSAFPQASSIDTVLQQIAAQDGPDPRLSVVAAADLGALDAALGDATGAHSQIVRFKDGGDTYTIPPLDVWLRAATYRILGATELASRLPSAVMCLLALWILMLTVRTVWTARVATLTGLVLVTTPLFFAQARSAAGEPSLILALTLVGCGVLLAHRGRSTRVAWSYLVAGFLLGFLAGGLFYATVAVGLTLVVPLIAGERRLSAWAPGLALGAVTGLLALWVLSQPPDGFASQFRFTQPLFSAGPSAYSKNFDMVIRQLGFGLFPWSPLVAVAVGAATFYAVQKRDRLVLLVAAWFLIPTVAVMVGLKDFNHIVFPAAPAAALAVGLLLEQLLQKKHVTSYFVSLALVFMFYILYREVAASPEPLVDFLAYDPPFADKGALSFPEGLKLNGLVLVGVLLVGANVAGYFADLPTVARRAMTFFRDKLPYTLALGLVLIALATNWLIRIGDMHRVAARQANLAVVGDGQRTFIQQFATPLEPAFLVGIGTVVVLLLTALFKYGLPGYGQRLGQTFFRVLPAPRAAYQVGAAVLLALAGALAFSVTYPADYWGELFFSLPSLAAYGGIGLLSLAVWRMSGGDRRQVAAVAVALLALVVVTRLVRDAGWYEPWVALVVFVGWVCLMIGVTQQLLVRPTRFVLGASLLVFAVLMNVTVPLVDRWSWVEPLLYPESPGYVVRYMFVGSKLAWLAYLAILALIANRYAHGGLTRAYRRVVDLSPVKRHGPSAVVAILLVALLSTLVINADFQRELAYNVSQKHILDTYYAAETDEGARARLFKHGSFAAHDRKDANFYTNGIAEIRDRQAALRALVGDRDQVVSVETPAGTDDRILQGWDPANDQNGDQFRDHRAVAGLATAVGPQTLTDANQAWTPNAFVGQRLVDAAGRTWSITGNDATTLTVSGAPLSFDMGTLTRRYYAIDAVDSPAPRATAVTAARRGLLIPAEKLSELNHAFRKLSGGRHLPILDGRSYRALLAISQLAPGETQQNRLARATYTQEQFDALELPGLRRVWGSFEDLIQVVGYRFTEPFASKNDTYEITVYYKALKPIGRSYKIFVHGDLQGGGERLHGDHWPLNPTRHSDDNKNCGGCFRTDHWMPGDIVADTYAIDVGQVASGDYMLWVGFYLPGPDTRIKVVDWDRQNARHDGANRLGVGTFRVR